MYHFFTSQDNITGDKVYITGRDVNHIKNVLRMKPGEELLVSDGAGADYACSIESLEDDRIVCAVTGKEAALSEPSVKFFLFQGLPKADKFEHIIQKSVELGVYEIIPVQTSRSIVKYDDKKAGAKKERWQKIAESAAKQSRRGIIPEVKDVMSFKQALEYAGSMEAGLDLLLIPYENFKDMHTTKEVVLGIKPESRVGIFIGPEGGFDEKEVKAACDAGARQISLGSRILRTETAPLMLLSVLMFNDELSRTTSKEA